MIEVLSAGPFATVQDLGRHGHRAIGVSVSGAMDGLALRTGNLLLGNPEGAAGIETTGAPLVLRFAADTAVAVTGAPAAVTLDDVTLPNFWCTPVRAGQTLSVAPSGTAMWRYVCVAGGIDCARVMGSRSTDTKIGIGGPLDGKALQRGTMLRFGKVGTAAPDGNRVPHDYGVRPPEDRRAPDGTAVIRVLPAREYDRFRAEDRAAFWDAAWQVRRESNRMGYRLDGPTLRTTTPQNLPSYGLVLGIVQVPPDGQPIVQLAEANTMGGYPKFGVVIEPDLRRLVQSRPGTRIRMERVDRDAAIAARAQDRAYLASVADAATLACA